MERWRARGRQRGTRWVFDHWQRAEPRYRIRRTLAWLIAAIVVVGMADRATGDALSRFLAALVG